MAYATLQQFNEYSNIAGANDDTLREAMLARAQAIVESHTGRVFEAIADTTRYFDPVRHVGGRTLYLDRDLAQVTEITNGDGEVLVASDYVTEPRNEGPYYAIVLRSDSDVSWTFADYPENAIAVKGRWAYSVVAPDPIVHATLRLAAWMYRQRDTSIDPDRPVVSPDGAMLMPSRLPADVVEVLRPFRRKVLG